MTDTITAIATPHGSGGISIVRLSGKQAYSYALKLINLPNLKPRFAHFVKISSLQNEFIDEGICIFFKAPFSFTGEDIVEFQIHGGFLICENLINELIKLGARLARPGEFSQRAFLNGKMDMAKAESIQAMIEAKSKSSLTILSRTMQGELANFVDEMRGELVRVLAYVETCIDYADDDLPEDILSSTEQLLKDCSKKLKNIVEISTQRRGLIDGFKVAIVGKPNVGKSSILNSLLKYDRAIISDEAGTTRDRIEENLQIGTHLVRIIDTAGIRQNAGKIESIGIDLSYKAISEADIVLAVFDGSNLSDSSDLEILQICKNSQKKVFYLLNKDDLELKFDINLAEFGKVLSLNSHKTSIIVDELQIYLNSQDTNSLMLSSTRQISACENALYAIDRAGFLLGELELFAYELNLAIFHIGSITKPVENGEILDSMFGNFCLGK